MGILSPVSVAELAEVLSQRTWWFQVLGFMHRLANIDEGSLRHDIMSDNIHDACGNSGCCNWADRVQKQSASMGVAFPFSDGHIHNVDHLALAKTMLAPDMLQTCKQSLLGSAHNPTWSSAPRGAKLSTYL